MADEISRATAEWKGHKVTVKLTIQNLQAKIDVIPTPTTWILKELRLPPTADRMKAVNGGEKLRFLRWNQHHMILILVKHIGNLSFDQILLIARQMRPRSGAKKLEV